MKSLAGGIAVVIQGTCPAPPPGSDGGTVDLRMGAAGAPAGTTVRAALYTGRFPLGTVTDHRRGRPDEALAAFIRQASLFRGRPVRYATAHRPDAFRQPPTPAMLAAEGAGVPVPTVGDLRRRAAVAPDVTGAALVERGHRDLPVEPVAAVARRLVEWAEAGEDVVLELDRTTPPERVGALVAAVHEGGAAWLVLCLPEEGGGEWPDTAPVCFARSRTPWPGQPALPVRDLLPWWWGL